MVTWFHSTPPHWASVELPFFHGAYACDIFDGVNVDFPEKEPGRLIWKYANDREVYIGPRIINTLRGCSNRYDAMKDFRAYLWARSGNASTPTITNSSTAEDFKLQVPALDIDFAFVQHGGKEYGFAFTRIAGTSIPVDIAEAMRAAVNPLDPSWVTPALFFAPHHAVINPHGGSSIERNAAVGTHQDLVYDAVGRALARAQVEDADIQNWEAPGAFFDMASFNPLLETPDYDGLADIESISYVSGQDVPPQLSGSS